jgi:hypothetical protein
VLRKYIVTTTLALACGVALAAAQDGQRPSTPTPSPSPSTGAASRQTSSTFVGCLYAESQIPGRAPNVAERAGVREDYILANATMGTSTSTAPGATPGAAGTSGSARAGGGMYKVEKISGDRLKALVGKRVEVTGRVDPEGNTPAGAASPNRSLGRDAISIAEIEASDIKEVAGTCPASPSAAPGATQTPRANPGSETPGAAAPGVSAPSPNPGGVTTPGSPGSNSPR